MMMMPPGVPYKALENFSKALYGTPGGTYSARAFRPVMLPENENNASKSRYVKGVPFFNKKYIKGVPFLAKWYIKG